MKGSGAGAEERKSEATIVRLAASAGSGKTFSLALHFIRRLLAEGEPNWSSILAVTFTRKAAGEMRSRILSWLKGLAGLELADGWEKEKYDRELKAVIEATGRPEEELRILALNSIEKLFEDYSSFQVSTIDSFLSVLAGAAAMELGLPVGGEPVIDARGVRKEVIPGTMENDGGNGKISDTVGSILSYNPDLTWNIEDEFLKWCVKYDSLRNRAGGVLDLVESSPGAFSKIKNRVKADAAELLDGLPDKDTSLMRKVRRELSAVCNDEGVWKFESTAYSKSDPPGFTKKNRPPDELINLWSDFRSALSEWVLRKALMRAGDDLEILSLIDKDVDAKLAGRGQYLLESLPLIFAEFFLREEGAVPMSYFYWGERIKHFMFDEFQDTSPVQWNAFRPLVEEALSTGGSLFYVGDVKQAIYGFRGGSSELFNDVTTEFASFGAYGDVLPRNYRSGRVLVDFTGEIFSEEGLKGWPEYINASKKDLKVDVLKNGIDAIVEEFSDSGQDAVKDGGYVRAERVNTSEVEGGRGEALAFLTKKAAEDVFKGDKGRLPGEVAFLLRKNRDVETVTATLSSLGFPVTSQSTVLLESVPVLNDIVSLLRFLHSPLDDPAFASFASGSLFESVANGTDKPWKARFHRFLSDREKRGGRPLYSAFRDSFPELWEEWIEPFFRSVGHRAPYDLIQDILCKFDARRKFPDSQAFFYHLLDCVEFLESEGGNTLEELIEFWDDETRKEERRVPLPEAPGAIRVMTVHGAKGLEFPVVVLLDPSLDIKVGSPILVKTQDGRIPLRFNQKESVLNEDLFGARLDGLRESIFDELRLFYVAVTRAAEELFIYLPAPEHESKRLLKGKKLPPIALPEGGLLERGERTGSRLKAGPPPWDKIPAGMASGEWERGLSVKRPELLSDTHGEAKRAVRRGTLLHKAIEKEASTSHDVREALSPEGASDDEVLQISALMEKLERDDRTRPLIKPAAEAKVRNEVPLVDERGELFIVDRVIEEPGRITVVDWKTGGRNLEKHEKQVMKYCSLLSEIYTESAIEGYIVYVDELSVERVK